MGRFESSAMRVGSFGRGSGSMEECALSEGVREQGEQLGVLLIVSRSCAEERGPELTLRILELFSIAGNLYAQENLGDFMVKPSCFWIGISSTIITIPSSIIG